MKRIFCEAIYRTLERSDPYSTSAASKPQAWCFRVIFGSTSIFYSHFKKKNFFFFLVRIWKFFEKFFFFHFWGSKILTKKFFFWNMNQLAIVISTTLNTLKTKSGLNSFSPRNFFLRFLDSLNTVLLVKKSTFWHFDPENGSVDPNMGRGDGSLSKKNHFGWGTWPLRNWRHVRLTPCGGSPL